MLTSSNIRSAADRTLHIDKTILSNHIIGAVGNGYYQIRIYNNYFTVEFEVMNKKIVTIRSAKSNTNEFKLDINENGVIYFSVNETDEVYIDIEYSSSLIELFTGEYSNTNPKSYEFGRFYTDLDISVKNISVDENLTIQILNADNIDTKTISLGNWVFSKAGADNTITISIKS